MDDLQALDFKASEPYRMLFETLPVGLVYQDASGQIVAANPAAEEILGLTLDQMQGRTSLDPRWRTVHEDGSDFPGQDHPAMVSLRTGELARAVMGVYHPLDDSYRWIQVTATPYFNAPGAPANLVMAALQDITELKHAQAEAAQLAERLKLAKSAARIGIWDWDILNNRLVWDEEMLRLHHISAEAFNGQFEDWASRVHPDDLDLCNENLQQALRGEKEFDIDFRVVWADGSVHWQRGVGLITRDTHHRPVRMVGINYDITESIEAQKKIRQDEEKFYKAFNNGLIAMEISRADTQQIMEVNEGFLKMFEYRREQVIGRTPQELGLIDPNQMDHLIHEMREQGYIQDAEITLRTSTGKLLYLLSSTQLIVLNGVRHTMATSIDITERKQAELALFESREDYRSLIESLDSAVLKADYDGHYRYINQVAARYLGRTPEEIVGKTFVDLLTPEEAARNLANVRQVIESGVGNVSEIQMQFTDGETRWFQGSIQPVWNRAGQAVQAVITSTDITKIKAAEQKLAETNAALEKALKARDEFLAAMSHELRTPLTAILGLSEALQMETYGQLNEKQLKSVQNIERSGHRLLALINDVIDFTRVQSGQLNLHPAKCLLNGLCYNSLQSVKKWAGGKNQDLVLTLPPEKIYLTIDEGRIHQALTNLLNNAIKFTPEGGRIELAASQDLEAREIRICVSDTGIGIQAEDLGRLFRPFVQLDARLSRKYEGTGLGLVLVKALVEAQGGRIEVESTFGQGSRFTIHLPWQPGLEL